MHLTFRGVSETSDMKGMNGKHLVEDWRAYKLAEEIHENSPTAIGYSAPEDDRSFLEAWQVVQQGHAVANACNLVAVNRIGFEGDPSNILALSQEEFAGVGPDGENGIKFWGSSFITNPDGLIIKQASPDKEEILLDTTDLSRVVESKKRISFPYRNR